MKVYVFEGNCFVYVWQLCVLVCYFCVCIEYIGELVYGNVDLLEVVLQLGQLQDGCCYLICQYVESYQFVYGQGVVYYLQCVYLYDVYVDQFVDQVYVVIGQQVDVGGGEFGGYVGGQLLVLFVLLVWFDGQCFDGIYVGQGFYQEGLVFGVFVEFVVELCVQ